MPRKGYRSITLKEDVYSELEKRITLVNRTVPEVIQDLIEQAQEASH